MKHNPMIGKHVHNNRESREGQVLRFIREARKLSLKDVADKLKMKSMDVDHFENGRRFYKPEDVEMFLQCYSFAMEDFKALMELKVLNKQVVNHIIIQNNK
jgi:transcriptional regulator with XRE-family HTH domain